MPRAGGARGDRGDTISTDHSIDYLKHHLVIAGLLLAVNVVFIVQSASDHSTLGVIAWSVLAVLTVAHLFSLVASYRHQSRA